VHDISSQIKNYKHFNASLLFWLPLYDYMICTNICFTKTFSKAAYLKRFLQDNVYLILTNLYFSETSHYKNT